MSELRYDPLSRVWVLSSEKRAQRPQGGPGNEPCPFCPGQEHQSGFETARIWDSAGSWRSRSVPNKFNVLAIEPNLNRTGAGVYLRENGVGAHEVLVEHPYDDHRQSADLTVDELASVLFLARIRMLDLQRDSRFKYPVLFKNSGKDAGQTMEHPHWQLIALPIVPRSIETALDECREFFQQRSCCLVCQIMRDENKAKERVVQSVDEFLLWAPYVSRFPYELMLAPIIHSCRFESTKDEHIVLCARMLRRALRLLRSSAGDPDYNIVLFTSPWFQNDPRDSHGSTVSRDFHWFIRILPRMVKQAGFEIGTGFYVNHVTPERVAETLRETRVPR